MSILDPFIKRNFYCWYILLCPFTSNPQWLNQHQIRSIVPLVGSLPDYPPFCFESDLAQCKSAYPASLLRRKICSLFFIQEQLDTFQSTSVLKRLLTNWNTLSRMVKINRKSENPDWIFVKVWGTYKLCETKLQ